MGEVDQPFKLFEGYPRLEIHPSTLSTLDDTPVVTGCLMSVEYVAGPHPLDVLQVSSNNSTAIAIETTHPYE